MKKTAILITGAAGFIGSHLVTHLLAIDTPIVGLDSFNDYYNPAIKWANIIHAQAHPLFTLVQGSICDPALLESLHQRYTFSAIIHLAAYAGVRPSIETPDLYYDTNINGTKNILDLAKKNKCTTVLLASSSSVYGNNKKVPFSEIDAVDHPISPYAATKKMTEIMAHTYHHLYGIHIACLRFFTVYGPRQRPEMAIHKFCRMINANTPIPVYNFGKCLRDYTYIDDIIQGILCVLHTKNIGYDCINLGGSHTISTLDLIALLEKELNKKAHIQLLKNQAGDVDKTYADITHAKKRYGYAPIVDITTGINHFVTWFQTQKSY